MNNSHIPILLDTLTEKLTENYPNSSETWIHVDCTLGGGGHFQAILNALQSKNSEQPFLLIGIDQDPKVIKNAEQQFGKEIKLGIIKLFQCRFSELPGLLGTEKISSLLADLGFSSNQMDDPERGLSFKSVGPLDMRLNPNEGEPFDKWILNYSEDEIGAFIRDLGEERYWRRIANSIFKAFHEGSSPTTPAELSDLIVKSLPPPARFKQKIHPATRTFQAFRIAINEELEELDLLLDNGTKLIKTGGRVAIISFHSLEDRRVKWFFKDRNTEFFSLSKKPIQPEESEITNNPRSRSAKLRIVEKK